MLHLKHLIFSFLDILFVLLHLLLVLKTHELVARELLSQRVVLLLRNTDLLDWHHHRL